MRCATILAASMLFVAPLTAQEQPGEDEHPAREDASAGKMLERAEKDRAAAHVNDHTARMALQHYGRCIAGSTTGEAARVISMDFTSPTYRRALRMLSDDAAKSCASKTFQTGVLRSANLLFAGEVAEALIEKSGAPLTAQLAKAAAAPATTGFSLTDKMAICVIRSVPDQVAALFATERDSPEEVASIGALALPAQVCGKATGAARPISISPAGLRSMLATAAFRSIRSTGTAS